MYFFRKIRSALAFLRDSQWVDAPVWEDRDKANLTAFLATDSGRKLSELLLNFTLRQQAYALSSTSNLKYESGYCQGAKGAILFVQSLALPLEPITDAGDQTPTGDE